LTFVIPILLVFLFGIIDFGLALNTANTNTNVANIAAREASVIGTATSATCVQGTTTNTYTTLQAWAQCEMVASGAGTPSVCIYDTADGVPTSSTQQQTYTTGDPIKVEVSSVFNWTKILTGGDLYIGKVESPTTTITSSAELRLEDSLNASATSGTNPFLSPSCTS
jgi:Flp pilus assembly protein TadG